MKEQNLYMESSLHVAGKNVTVPSHPRHTLLKLLKKKVLWVSRHKDQVTYKGKKITMALTSVPTDNCHANLVLSERIQIFV